MVAVGVWVLMAVLVSMLVIVLAVRATAALVARVGCESGRVGRRRVGGGVRVGRSRRCGGRRKAIQHTAPGR